jgi:hypothetical protein
MEYPRPLLQREQWMSLNGLWHYAIRPETEQMPVVDDGSILVPFCIESALSGVRNTLGIDERLWYSRKFVIPDSWHDKRIFLHFGAIDWETDLWINDQYVGKNRGGYHPFSFEITTLMNKKEEQHIRLAVYDPTDHGKQPRGKQVRKPGGIYYTSVSGIWQSVWLEPVPESFITGLTIIPDIDQKQTNITVEADKIRPDDSLQILIKTDSKIVAKSSCKPGEKAVIVIPDMKLWSPENPFLYDIEVWLVRNGEVLDTVKSYTGMRKIGLAKDEFGFTRIFLNNQFVFQNGPLDQGYWPDGLYTAPTDNALKGDIEAVKAMGFNMLRKHVKVEPQRFYYWCDRLGILVWQDMPNGDKPIGRDAPDLQRTAESAEQFIFELEHVIDALKNHPSIIVWVPFNEGWGQFDTGKIVNWINKKDPSRLVNPASGWVDRGVGDILDIHHYPEPRTPKAEESRAIVLGEFGGLGRKIDGHLWQKKHWGYRRTSTETELADLYEAYYSEIWRFKEKSGLSASVYTQLTDVETETNGLMTYDRAVDKLERSWLDKVNRGEYVSQPKISPDQFLFYKEILVIIKANEDTDIYYTLDDSQPTAYSLPYQSPIRITDNTIIRAVAINGNGESSREAIARYKASILPAPHYKYEYHSKYPASSDFALVDSKKGSKDYLDGHWQGFREDDLDVTVHFEEARSISEVSVNFLQDTERWIFFPKSVTIYVSPDGQRFEIIHTKDLRLRTSHTPAIITTVKAVYNTSDNPVMGVRVHAENIRQCPSWHPGAGGKTWIFADEISLN